MSQNYWVLFKILVVLFIASCKVVLTFEAVDEMQSVIIQMKLKLLSSTDFPVVLLIMQLYKVVLT